MSNSVLHLVSRRCVDDGGALQAYRHSQWTMYYVAGGHTHDFGRIWTKRKWRFPCETIRSITKAIRASHTCRDIEIDIGEINVFSLDRWLLFFRCSLLQAPCLFRAKFIFCNRMTLGNASCCCCQWAQKRAQRTMLNLFPVTIMIPYYIITNRTSLFSFRNFMYRIRFFPSSTGRRSVVMLCAPSSFIGVYIIQMMLRSVCPNENRRQRALKNRMKTWP